MPTSMVSRGLERRDEQFRPKTRVEQSALLVVTSFVFVSLCVSCNSSNFLVSPVIFCVGLPNAAFFVSFVVSPRRRHKARRMVATGEAFGLPAWVCAPSLEKVVSALRLGDRM